MKMTVRLQVLSLIAAVLVTAMAAYLALASRLVMKDKLAYVYEVESSLVSAKSDEVYGNLASLATKLAYFAETGVGPSRHADAAEPAARALVGTDPDLLSVEVWRKSGDSFQRVCRYVEAKRLDALGLADSQLPEPSPGADLLARIAAADGLLLQNTSLPPDAALLTLTTASSDGEQIIVANLHPDRLLRLFDEHPAYRALLIDSRGDVLLHPDAKMVLARANVLDLPIVRDALGSGAAREVKEFKGSDGAGWVGAFSRVGIGGLAVVTLVPRSVAWSAFHELAWRSVLFAIAVVLASLLLAIFFSRALTRPLVDLEHAAGKISRGELGTRVAVAGGNEIGRLAEAFNRMSRELAERETRLEEARARLIQTDRLATVGTLAAGVAHEINNPLTYINANLKFAASAVRGVAGKSADADALLKDVQTALSEAVNGAERVKAIVADLRLFSRRHEDERAEVDLAPVIEGALKMVGPELRRRAQIDVKLAPGLPRVDGNAGRLGQVFLNLLINAMQATPKGAPEDHRIRVSASSTADQIEVRIADDGSGIPPEILPRIFDPFFTTKPVGVGTGLGLSICHGIVTGMGGTIDVSSKVGGGTTFTLRFQAASAASKAPAPPSPKRAAKARPAEPTRVLVVDDDAEVVSAIRRMLEPAHRVTTAASGADALELLLGAHLPFDVILVDLQMPGLSGMDLHREVRRVLPGYEERMVFMTGGLDLGGAAEFLDAVPNPRIAKPFEATALEAAIAAGRRSCAPAPLPRATGWTTEAG